MLVIGSMIQPGFLSPAYLLQQLKVGSFLGIIATGMMLVILLGQIDLSVPWTVALGAMMASAAAAYGPYGEFFAIPFGILCGCIIGLINGFAVAYLRIPSMIITLAINVVAQGLMVAYSGGFAPQDSASPAMRWLGSATVLWIVPVPVIVWAVTGIAAVFLLTRTTFGRSVYGIGNKEAAAYLSGIPTQRVVMVAFMLCGALAAFGGVLLAGYSGKAAQSLGDPYLLPSIAAVVLGGTSILGGRGNYLGTIAGVIFITLLQSILGTLQMGEFGRQIAYGTIIVAMLLLYGRDKKLR
jgi:ribose transport system permease protein